MFVIGERINGMFKDVAKAIKEQDKKTIQGLVRQQVACGADALDVNVGPSVAEPKAAMEWLVSTIIEVTDKPLSIDTTKLDVMEAGLRFCKIRPIINSANANREKLDACIALAKKYGASIIALTMDKSGIPQGAEGRLELAAKIIETALQLGIDLSDIYIDAVILPVNVAQIHAKEVLKTIRECKLLADPPPKTILGLSNISQGAITSCKGLINRTFLAMAIGAGLDAAIMDPMDKELMDAAITSELLMEKHIYCDSFLDAYRKKAT